MFRDSGGGVAPWPEEAAAPVRQSNHAHLEVPVAFAALAVLVVNDHFLKATFGNALTGKLSDLAGLVLFPLVLLIGLECVLSGLGHSVEGKKTLIGICLVMTAAGFSSIQLFEQASSAYESTLTILGPGRARNTMDPSDLLALPILYLPWLIATRSRVQRHRN